jgi:hypothetical protein
VEGEAIVAVIKGRLDGFALLTGAFGTWGGAFQARWNGWPGNLDGWWRERVLVKIIGE